jgi:hypothetical protein
VRHDERQRVSVIRFVSVIDKEYVSAWWLDDVRAYPCS